ncbi:AEC family transporter [Sphingomonas morindae]|uniref:AEC family transporter n=1 Tax=Sphingomonas morindae TaxID=1541170 RepID=A0ABY4X3V1_9SPHN|nr:AEC family transporter [Sphingomonas morindae]USI71553.1 AEC family transporter [Sphingomonas morindae]
MSDFLLLCLPIFGMVAVGWMATAAGVTPPSALDVLGGFSFRFALPALVLHLIAREPLAALFEPAFFIGYLASGCLVFALTFAVFRKARRVGAARASARATTASVGNLGFLGPPIVVAFLGTRGTGPLAMAIVSEVMIVMSIGAVLIAGAGDRRLGTLLARSTIGNPVIVSILLGTGMAAARLPLPKALDDFLALLGASAAPTALFAVGGTLAVLRIDRTLVWVAVVIAGVKLALYPATVWCVLALGLGMDPFWSSAGALMAALPSAGSNFVLAQRYTDDADQTSAGIVLSTMIGIVTVPLVASLVLGR